MTTAQPTPAELNRLACALEGHATLRSIHELSWGRASAEAKRCWATSHPDTCLRCGEDVKPR